MQRIVKRRIVSSGAGRPLRIKKAGTGSRVVVDKNGNLYSVKPVNTKKQGGGVLEPVINATKTATNALMQPILPVTDAAKTLLVQPVAKVIESGIQDRLDLANAMQDGRMSEFLNTPAITPEEYNNLSTKDKIFVSDILKKSIKDNFNRIVKQQGQGRNRGKVASKSGSMINDAGGVAQRKAQSQANSPSVNSNSNVPVVIPQNNQENAGYNSFVTDYIAPGVAYWMGMPRRIKNAVRESVVYPIGEAFVNQNQLSDYDNLKYGNTSGAVAEAWKHVVDPASDGSNQATSGLPLYSRMFGYGRAYDQDAIARRLNSDYDEIDELWQGLGYDYRVDRRNGTLVDSNGNIVNDNPIDDYVQFLSTQMQGQGKKRTVGKIAKQIRHNKNSKKRKTQKALKPSAKNRQKQNRFAYTRSGKKKSIR